MGALLGFAASYDNRNTGDSDVIAWLEAIGDLSFDDSYRAVAAHYGHEPDKRLMPGHVRQRVKAMRRDRLERAVMPAPAPELTDDTVRYRETLSASIRSIADGKRVNRAIAPADASGNPVTPGLPPEQMEALKARLGGVKPKLTPQELAAQQAEESRREREGQDRKQTGGEAA